jgi:hypothetical protein
LITRLEGLESQRLDGTQSTKLVNHQKALIERCHINLGAHTWVDVMGCWSSDAKKAVVDGVEVLQNAVVFHLAPKAHNCALYKPTRNRHQMKVKHRVPHTSATS